MNTESIKKSINDKFNDLNTKIDILSLESVTIDNNEQIYGYTVNQLLEKINESKNETAYAYVAGFFDGEGWIGTTTDSRINPPSISLGTSVENTNFEVLIKMKRLFGGQIYLRKKPRENRKNHGNGTFMIELN